MASVWGEGKGRIQALRELATSPRDWPSFLRRGRPAVLRALVARSIAQARRRPGLRSLSELAELQPATTLGRLGATQESLYYVVRLIRPSAVVETGVYRGISSAFILAALHDNGSGQLYSLDLPSAAYNPGAGIETDSSPLPLGATTGFAIPLALTSRWKLTLGRTQDLLPGLLASIGHAELFLHDSEHTVECMTREYTQALPYLHPNGVLASDDISWNGAFDDFVRAHPELDVSIKVGGRLGYAYNRESASRWSEPATAARDSVGLESG
jgi:hypothetical protein